MIYVLEQIAQLMKVVCHRIMNIIQRIKVWLAIHKYYSKLYKANTLYKFASETETDKGFPGHGYVRVYDSFLSKLRFKKCSICEIGLLHNKFQHKSSYRKQSTMNTDKIYVKTPSINLWIKYFPKARIIGFDIEKFDPSFDKRFQFIQGDQSSRKDLEKIIKAQPEFDVIIDDGLHASKHQQITFSYLFRYLKPGGLYFIEDLHWQPQDLEQKDIIKTSLLLKKFESTGEWLSPFCTEEEKVLIENEVEDIYFFDSLMGSGEMDVRRFEDAMAVIKKKLR